MKSRRSWFWGIFLVLAAVLVVGSQFAGFVQIGFWTVLATVLLVALFIQCLMSRNFAIALLSVAVLYILYQKPLGLYVIKPWLLCLAALLAGIGLSMLFRRKPRVVHQPPPFPAGHGQPPVELNEDDNHPYAKVGFSASSRYLHSTALETGQFYCSFGALEVFFGQAQLAPAGAQIYLECSFGSIKLYVPRDWQVVDGISATLGGVSNDTRFSAPAEGAPVLTLSGSVTMGGIEIQYI